MSRLLVRSVAGSGLLHRLLWVGAALALGACSTLVPAPALPPPGLADEAGCAAWWAQLDVAVQRAGVDDAESPAIPGVPGLRADRIALRTREGVGSDAAARAAWLARAAELDRSGRAAEIRNLPAAVWPIGEARDAATAQARSEDCRERLLRQLRDHPTLAAAVAARAQVPSRYSPALRTLGLYPLTRIPLFQGVQGWQVEHEALMARWREQPPALQRHDPPAPSLSVPPVVPAGGWPRDALGLPRLTAAEVERWLQWHAPVIEVETRGDFDRFGAPVWSGDAAPGVDTRQPVVYRRLSHTRLGGRWLPQLVYTLWFPQRPPRGAFDLLSGALDGIVLRLTLDEDGQPLLLDSIHACGCYHLFFPSAALKPRAGAPTDQEWLFAPAPLPPLDASQRLVVRISSASHDVAGLGTAPRGYPSAQTGPSSANLPAVTGMPTGTPYSLRPEADLRSLPTPIPTLRRSLYGPDGLVPGTERGERWLFWPMGIASAGAMRQWGHHATAFVGQRLFDDPDLLEPRFERVAP